MWRGVWVNRSQRGLGIRNDDSGPLQSGRRGEAGSVLSVSIDARWLRYQQVHFPTRSRWRCFSCVTIGIRKMHKGFSTKSHGGILVVVRLESSGDSGLPQMMWQGRIVGRDTRAQGPLYPVCLRKTGHQVSDHFWAPGFLVCVTDFGSFHFTPITTYTFGQLYFHPAGSWAVCRKWLLPRTHWPSNLLSEPTIKVKPAGPMQLLVILASRRLASLKYIRRLYAAFF